MGRHCLLHHNCNMKQMKKQNSPIIPQAKTVLAFYSLFDYPDTILHLNVYSLKVKNFERDMKLQWANKNT